MTKFSVGDLILKEVEEGKDLLLITGYEVTKSGPVYKILIIYSTLFPSDGYEEEIIAATAESDYRIVG